MKYPLPSNYIDRLAGKLLQPIKQGESAFIRWFPGNGKTALLSQILSNKFFLHRYLGKFYQRFLFIYTESYFFSIQDLKEYFEVILDEFQNTLKEKNLNFQKQLHHRKSESLIHTIKTINRLCSLVIEEGYEVVFIIDSIDDMPNDLLKHLFILWEHILESNRERIHTYINVYRNNILTECITQSGLIQNIIQIPLPGTKESIFFVHYYCKQWGLKLSGKDIQIIFTYSGNDPTLIKEILRLYIKNKSKNFDLLAEPSLLIKTKINFNYLSQEEKDVIECKLKTDRIPIHFKNLSSELINLNYWDQKYHIPRLFEKVILDRSYLGDLKYDKHSQSLIFGDIDLKKKLTSKELNILLLLYENKMKIVNRDKIAKSLWGNRAFDKYSDWAIDKTISRLRKKMARLGFYYQIKTIKKRGVSLEM